MRITFVALVAVAALFGAEQPATAQGVFPFTIEARGGFAFPTGDFESGVKAGYLIDGTVKASPLPFVSLYAGWTLAEFAAEDQAGLTGIQRRVKDSGFRTGGEVGVPLVGLMSGVAPYLQVGAIFNRAEVEVSGEGTGTGGFESERTLGFEVAGGSRISLGKSISLTPELRYRKYSPEFDLAPEVDLAGEISYLVGSLGFTLHF